MLETHARKVIIINQLCVINSTKSGFVFNSGLDFYYVEMAASIDSICAGCEGFIAYVLLTNECFFPSWQHTFMGNPT